MGWSKEADRDASVRRDERVTVMELTGLVVCARTTFGASLPVTPQADNLLVG